MASVRGERVILRDRDIEREYEGPHRRTYTTVKRYQVPDSIARSVVSKDDDFKEKIVIRRGVRDDDERRSSFSEFREEREADIVSVTSPRSRVREYRFERDEDEFDVEKYHKSTEYFQQPQPIIIRNSAPQPIIIREERRAPQKIYIRREPEPQYEFVERRREVEEVKEEDGGEVEEEKETSTAIVKAEETAVASPAPAPAPEPPQEGDYFYERKIITRRRRSSSFERRPEVRPRDSASNYSSDDSYEYVRRERIVEDGRDTSPHHKRHLAEGALAGIGAAEIIRQHRKKKGENPGRAGAQLIGGAAIGALGVEALSRVRSMRSLRQSRSRSRSVSRDRHRSRHQSRRRSRSRSRDNNNGNIGKLAAIAAVGAIAGYALSNKGNKGETIIVKDGHRRRSHSRRRRGSFDSNNNRSKSAMNPSHRNSVIAGTGIATAAAAGLWDRFRSRSRGKSRSKSTVRRGLPIAAAGLGGAALAGLYENNKANQEAKKNAIIQDELRRGRRRRSRSRGAPAYSDSYYSDEEPGYYRRRDDSEGSSPDTRRQNFSRSRSRGAYADRSRSRSVADPNRRRLQQDSYDNSYSNDFAQGGYGNAYHQPSAPPAPYFPPPPTGEVAEASRDAPYGGGQQQPGGGYAPYNPADYAAPNINANTAYPNDTFAGDNRYGGDAHADDRRGRDPENMV